MADDEKKIDYKTYGISMGAAVCLMSIALPLLKLKLITSDEIKEFCDKCMPHFMGDDLSQVQARQTVNEFLQYLNLIYGSPRPAWLKEVIEGGKGDSE
jgi:hypothetical protein